MVSASASACLSLHAVATLRAPSPTFLLLQPRCLPPAPPRLSNQAARGGVPTRPHFGPPTTAHPTPHPAPQSHTILLIQTGDNQLTRTYLDFPTPALAWDTLTRMFEQRLKELTPGVQKITYDVQDLFRYLDNLHDVSVMMCVGGRCARAQPGGGRGARSQRERGAGARGDRARPAHDSAHCCGGRRGAAATTPAHLLAHHTPARSLDRAAKKYDAFPRDTIKTQIYAHLKRSAGGR